MANKIRFTRSDYDKLCNDQFYGIKEYPNYHIRVENNNKKVAYWDSVSEVLHYNNDKRILSWLQNNSYIKQSVNESVIGNQEILSYTKPQIVDTIKEKIETVDDIKVVRIIYNEGSPYFNVVLRKDLEESYLRDEIFGKTMLISKFNQYKQEIFDLLNDELNLLTINLTGYDFNKAKMYVDFSLNIIGSFTVVKQNK